jgi:hypothetical protein
MRAAAPTLGNAGLVLPDIICVELTSGHLETDVESISEDRFRDL